MKNFNVITSKENSLIKLASSLQGSARARCENGMFALEGLRICEDAFDNGIRFDKLIISETALRKYEDKVLKLEEAAQQCYIVPDSLFTRISDTQSPQGIMAICKSVKDNTGAPDKNGKYIALENVADPANLGAVARTAEALGVSGIILSSGGCDRYNPKALRASMGTLLRVPVYMPDDFAEYLSSCGLKLYACVVNPGARGITDVNLSGGIAILIGNEANGLSDTALSIATEHITIPMRGKTESLNAATAAAIAMWEMMR